LFIAFAFLGQDKIMAWEVLEALPAKQHGHTVYCARCVCGNVRHVQDTKLNGRSKSCGCTLRKMPLTITANGETLSIEQWAARLGCSVDVIRARLRMGWTHVAAVTRPVRQRRR
jgi:hypothetical protein